MSDRILRLQHVEVRVPDLELCTAYYTESMPLPRAVVPLGKKVESVIIGPAGPMAEANLEPWPKCRQA